MTARLLALCIDALDPERLAHFWSRLLDREVVHDPVLGTTLLPDDDTGFRIRFVPTDRPKTRLNHTHPDLTSSSPEDQQRTVQRALDLGGRHFDVGQRGDEGHVVLADPEGNEFDVIEPGNRFLAGTARIGALASDGSRACGVFWSRALGWPLVWDQGEETAIQAPYGGTKISWGGPPYRAKDGKERWHLDLAADGGGGDDHEAEVERLLGLGASRVDIGQGDVAWVVLADPDGHEFCLWPSDAFDLGGVRR